MKKRSRGSTEASDDLQPEYRFDYSTARPNPYAARLKGQAVVVVLDPEVAAAFPTSESVNKALRAVMGLVPRRSMGRALMSASPKTARPSPRTSSARARRRSRPR